jgi:hypothetical protein
MRHVRHLNVLDHPSTLLVTVSKLPDHLQDKWRERAYEISRFAMPTFAQLVQFVGRASDIDNDPVFGKPPCEPRLANFSSSAKATDPIECTCIYCEQKGHSLLQCPKFKDTSVEERRSALKDLNACFGCLQPGHYVSRCRNRLRCRKCDKQHPTCLHIDGFVMSRRHAS